MRTSALGDETFSGRISRLDAAADGRTGAFIAEIRLPEDARLKTGFVGDAILETAARDGADNSLLVPAEALFEVQGGSGFVHILSDKGKKARRVKVQFLGFRGDEAAISGLAAGSAVITAGGAFVTDGGAVAVMAQP
jgi:multidrug efflux pump subunit AcrA (membrane-fusion protein)